MKTVTTAWGRTKLVEEVRVPQRVGQRRFEAIAQLLEDEGGETFVRFAYSTGGSVRRGPVTLRERDLQRLGEVLGRAPRLAEALRGAVG